MRGARSQHRIPAFFPRPSDYAFFDQLFRREIDSGRLIAPDSEMQFVVLTRFKKFLNAGTWKIFTDVSIGRHPKPKPVSAPFLITEFFSESAHSTKSSLVWSSGSRGRITAEIKEEFMMRFGVSYLPYGMTGRSPKQSTLFQSKRTISKLKKFLLWIDIFFERKTWGIREKT